MNPQELIEKLGVSSLDARIYLLLLKHGSLSIRTLAAQTQSNRGIVYESLKSLTKIGLVAYTQKNQRKSYIAESPEAIRALISERQQTLNRLEIEASQIIPNLMAYDRRKLEEPAVAFYEGDEGIATILRDVIATTSALPDKSYRVYSSKSLRKYLYRRFPSFTKRRIAAEIFVRAIAIGEGGEPDVLSERRWLNFARPGALSAYTIIYGSKLAMISLSADGTPYGVVIDEPGVAQMQMQIFDHLWESL